MDRRSIFSNMQKEKGLLILSSITSNFIIMWYILLSCKDWIRKLEKLTLALFQDHKIYVSRLQL